MLFLYGMSLTKRHPLIKGDQMYNIMLLVILLVLGVFIINISYSPAIEEDGSFKTAPKTINKSRTPMIILYIIVILLISTMIGIDIYSNPINPLGLLPYDSIKNIFGLGASIALIGIVYLLINTITYNVKKYNLPNTWSK
jgi:hypothetical protein